MAKFVSWETFNSRIYKLLSDKNIEFTGAFHIGAHDCEELPFYNNMGIQSDNVLWVDAINSLVLRAKSRGIENIYNATITDKDDEEVAFNISNNAQSSSVLELGTHSHEHPMIHYVDKIITKSITIDTFCKRENIDMSKYDFWNFDIQSAELMALKGATESIKHAKAIYLEVNEEELYKNCGLITDIDIFLSKYNFKRVLTNMTANHWGDALYIKGNV